MKSWARNGYPRGRDEVSGGGTAAASAGDTMAGRLVSCWWCRQGHLLLKWARQDGLSPSAGFAASR